LKIRFKIDTIKNFSMVSQWSLNGNLMVNDQSDTIEDTIDTIEDISMVTC
jgi:hypothetical protein